MDRLWAEVGTTIDKTGLMNIDFGVGICWIWLHPQDNEDEDNSSNNNNDDDDGGEAIVVSQYL
jgi:hypothetical protein